MKRVALIALLCVFGLMIRPGAASACSPPRPPADGYYTLGEERFCWFSEKSEYYYRKSSNIVVVRVSAITDAEGNKLDETLLQHRYKRMKNRGEVDALKYPLTFHYDVLRAFKGDLGGSFVSTQKEDTFFPCANVFVDLGFRYLLQLPELPETGTFNHATIAYSKSYMSTWDVWQERLDWLEKRVRSGKRLNDDGEETYPSCEEIKKTNKERGHEQRLRLMEQMEEERLRKEQDEQSSEQEGAK